MKSNHHAKTKEEMIEFLDNEIEVTITQFYNDARAKGYDKTEKMTVKDAIMFCEMWQAFLENNREFFVKFWTASEHSRQLVESITQEFVQLSNNLHKHKDCKEGCKHTPFWKFWR